MNGHFSYELDERQIKLMMHDAELEDDASFWNKFETLNTQEAKPSIEFKLPKFHISQSVFVPVLFIAIIGLLSVMLFSLVDFKKKETSSEEILYKPVVKPTTKKIVITKPNPIPKEKVIPVSVDSSSLLVKVNNDSIKQVAESIKTKELVKDSPRKKDSVAVSNQTTVKKEKSGEPRKKKRRRRVVAEEIPTIASPLRLEEKANEPDLDLK